ncbi:hypothetical protein RJ640_017698 [Escallonia rubra]|uniref:NAC domain-containing protein n=1 Tax=Escallonia rubra TaxID=112253 RepID=A0AA88UEV9_9ASTE|nr:hypothetical protein RJ640_017698 [Escallonia rubra]
MASISSLAVISRETNSKIPMASGSSLPAISPERNSKMPMASGSSLALISCEKNGSDSDSYCWKKHLPPGQRFQPTRYELICFYLYSKFLPIQIPPGIVSSVDDIYDYEPHELPERAFEHDGEKMYFFTSLRKKFANGNKVKRDIKGNRGYWKATQARKDVKGCTGTTVGTTTPLTYYNKDAVKTPWLMTEHRLTDDLIARFKPKKDREPVLCTVYYHVRKKESGADGDDFALSVLNGRLHYHQLAYSSPSLPSTANNQPTFRPNPYKFILDFTAVSFASADYEHDEQYFQISARSTTPKSHHNRREAHGTLQQYFIHDYKPHRHRAIDCQFMAQPGATGQSPLHHGGGTRLIRKKGQSQNGWERQILSFDRMWSFLILALQAEVAEYHQLKLSLTQLEKKMMAETTRPERILSFLLPGRLIKKIL